MTDREALLAAILDKPDDDTARVVYADWLEEHGQEEYAEFVRVQCELARLSSGDVSGIKELIDKGSIDAHQAVMLYQLNNHDLIKKQDELRRRERELWLTISQEWVNSLRPIACVHLGDVPTQLSLSGIVTRGFVSRLTCSWDDWLAHAAVILAEQPVEEVRLTTRPEPWHEFIGYTGEVLDRYPAGRAKTVRPHRWPRITFHLPPAPVVRPTREEVERDLRQFDRELCPEGYRVEWLGEYHSAPETLVIAHMHNPPTRFRYVVGTDRVETNFAQIRCPRLTYRGNWHAYVGRCDECRIVYIMGLVPAPEADEERRILFGDPAVPRPMGIINARR